MKKKNYLKKFIGVLGKIILGILLIPVYLLKAVFGGFADGCKEGRKQPKGKEEDDLQWIDEIECFEAALDDDD